MHSLKTKLSLTICFVLATLALNAQTTTVTATITDSDSSVWSNANWTAVFVPNPNFPNLNQYSINGTPIQSSTYNQYIQVNGTTNGSGVLSTTLLNNADVQPAGSSYRFVVGSNTSAQATTYPTTIISGASISLTTFLSTNAIAPRFAALPGSFGYADVEISVVPTPGALYFNTTSNVTRQYVSGSWVDLVGNGTVSPGAATEMAIYTGANTVAGDPNLLDVPGFLEYSGTIYGTGGVIAQGGLEAESTFSATGNGAVNQAALLESGTIYNGGTGTTTYPYHYYDCNGSTAPTTWSTNGTITGINTCSGFNGNFLDFHANGGPSLFSVNSAGGTTASSYNITAANCIAATTVNTPCNAAGPTSVTGQTANISATTIITPSVAGWYQFSCSVILTTPATVSSTMPGCNAVYTDNTDGAVKSGRSSTTLSGNVTSDSAGIVYLMYVKASTNIQYATASYASSGATAMQYTVYYQLLRVN